MVLLHGLTESGAAWPDAVRRWQGAYHLVAVDLRGHGLSPRFDDEQLRRTCVVWVSDVVDLLRSMEGPHVLVGHSLGGLLALRAAAAEGTMVRGLVLEDPARPSGEPLPDPVFVAHQEEFLNRFADGGRSERERMRVESSWSAEEIDAWAECKPQVDRRMIRQGLVLGDAAWETVFNRLTVPTLLVAPEDSDMAPDERAITNPLVRVCRIVGVGHCVRRDDPNAYHALVDPFLAAIS